MTLSSTVIAMWFRKKRRKPEHPRPGNTSAVMLAGEDQDGDIDGLAPLQGEPLARWTTRSVAAASSRTVLVLPEGVDTGAWRAALGHSSPVLARERQDDTLRIAHVPREGRPVAAVQAALAETDDPYLLLIDPCLPLLAPDVHLALIERIAGHDAVAFHLDGWWRPLPALWRRGPLEAALEAARADGVGDLSTLLDRVDARPLGEEFLAALSPDKAAFRPVQDADALEAAEAWLAARGAGSDAA